MHNSTVIEFIVYLVEIIETAFLTSI